MKAVSLFYLSSKHLLRLYIPDSLMRGAFVFIVSALFFGALALGIVFGLHPPPQWRGGFRSEEFVSNLSSLFFLLNSAIMMFPTLLTIRGSLKLLNAPEAISLVLLSPASPVSRFWSSIGPLLFFSSIPFLIVICPFIVMFIFLDPAISAATILYFMVISGWSVVLCFTTIMILVNFLGREKAMRFSYGLPFLLLFLPLSFISALENFRAYAPVIGYWQLVFFGISLVLLPKIFTYTTNSFYTLLSSRVENVKEYPAPAWGTYNPWSHLKRQAATLGLIPLGTFIILMLTRVITLEGINEGIFALSVFSFVTSPVHIIMQEEKNTPDRWSLAPSSFRLQSMIWLKLILPLFATGTIAVVILGTGHTIWMTWTLLITLLGTLTVSTHTMHKYPVFQNIVYFILLSGSFITQFFW